MLGSFRHEPPLPDSNASNTRNLSCFGDIVYKGSPDSHCAFFADADTEALADVAQLPPPRVEELFTAEPGTAVVGACVMGDALTGTALVLLTSDGRHHCLRPSGSLPTDQVLTCVVAKHHS